MNKRKDWKNFMDLFQKKESLLILFLVGLILLVIAIPTERKENKTTENVIQDTTATENEEDYCRELERRLEEILSYVSGVGKVEVMITLKDTGENIVEKDVSSQEAMQGGTENASKEEETVYEENDSGTTPYVINSYRPKVQGVLIVAQGADDPVVKQEIMEGVMALFEVESHKINIINME